MLSGRSQRWIKQARGEKGRRQGGTILRKNHRFENQDLDRLLMISGNGPTKEGKLLCTWDMCLKPKLPKSVFLQEAIAKNLATLQKLETYDPRITVPCQDVIGRVQPCPQYLNCWLFEIMRMSS